VGSLVSVNDALTGARALRRAWSRDPRSAGRRRHARRDTYQKFLGGNALVCSMSAVGHCGDSAEC